MAVRTVTSSRAWPLVIASALGLAASLYYDLTPETGIEGSAGAMLVIASSGLVFIGASMDSRVRAFDLKTGKELWRYRVDAPTVSLPAVYAFEGREYATFAVGGNSILSSKVSDQLVAFALPQ